MLDGRENTEYNKTAEAYRGSEIIKILGGLFEATPSVRMAISLSRPTQKFSHCLQDPR